MSTCLSRMQPSPQCLPTLGHLPSLSIDSNGPWLVTVPSKHHSHGVSIQSVDIDGVGGLTGPEQCPAVDVDAEIVRLSVWAQTLTGRGQHGELREGADQACTTLSRTGTQGTEAPGSASKSRFQQIGGISSRLGSLQTFDFVHICI